MNRQIEGDWPYLWIDAGIFPNDASIVRLVGAMMLERNDEWSLNRRYMQLECLQTVSDTAPTPLWLAG
jgi:putative transposase